MNRLSRRLRCSLGLAGLCSAVVFAAPAVEEEHPLLGFVVGSYRLVGQHPDLGLTYAGKARIERKGQGLELVRTVSGRAQRIAGHLRRADPGEAWVLAFAWASGTGQKAVAMNMTCLISSDLDNDARLSCHWGHAGNPHRQPGMEALFAEEPWRP